MSAYTSPFSDESLGIERVQREEELYACDACSEQHPYLKMMRYGRNEGTLLCDSCRDEMDEAVFALPPWITDATLTELLPVMAKAYATFFGRTERGNDGSKR